MQTKMKNLLSSSGLILVFFLSCSEAQGGASPYPQDCTQMKKDSPQTPSGVYSVQPAGSSAIVRVYCEMRADGGWTVFQRRSGRYPSFNRNWRDYKNGFGALAGDHWLGLENVFRLTNDNSKRCTLRVELEAHEGGSSFAEYNDFYLGNERMNYNLHVGDYRGNAGDAIRGAYPGIDQNGFGFSTIDRDNDGCSPCLFGDILVGECTSSEGGGWWYSGCGSASLNGEWHPYGDHIGWASGVHWLTWKGPAPYSAKASRMMIRCM